MTFKEMAPIQKAGVAVVAVGLLSLLVAGLAFAFYPYDGAAPFHPGLVSLICAGPLALALGLWVFVMGRELEKVSCPTCEHANPPYRVTCERCGAELPLDRPRPEAAATLTCPSCGRLSATDQESCEQCLSPFPARVGCPRCGARNFANSVACVRCGAPLWNLRYS